MHGKQVSIANHQESFMNTRRSFVFAASAVLALGMLPGAGAQQALPPVTVYKSPTCGCCGEWVKHMRASGFRVESRDVADVTPIRRKYGVPDEFSSCHTAIVAHHRSQKPRYLRGAWSGAAVHRL